MFQIEIYLGNVGNVMIKEIKIFIRLVPRSGTST